MVAPLRKKNSLEQTGFQLTETGFIYYGMQYKFDDVVETRIIKMVSSEYDYSISIILVMNTGITIQVTEQPTWTSNSKINNVQHIDEMFHRVSKKTWENRVNKYIRQVKELGYFDYCGWRFYPNQQKIVDIEKDRAYQINSTKFLRSYGYITVASMEVGLGAKILRRIIDKPRVINTIIDTDVFFALLKHYFHMQW